ncbi:MAG: pyridoxal-phosphate dependent enzyme [Candidatus Eremiobacteraeota bacterium]|nr:pyridoxal-phosphate dependent enzyme [Candidatus Eremiobacteraeota bacterium]
MAGQCALPPGAGHDSAKPSAMTDALGTIRPISIAEIERARGRIASTITHTPLLKLEHGSARPEIYLKLENLQPINSFKLRGAANAIASLPPDRRAEGVWTISAGNAGQGVAFAAREAGVPCTIVTIETAPETKVERMRALGARLVKAPFDACWEALERRAFPGVSGTFVHPFDDDDFIAGNGSIGLEIAEDLPSVEVVVAALGGGGLLTGVATAIKACLPAVRVFGAEPETAAPGALSFARGRASTFEGWQATFVDGAGGKSVFPRMWDRMKDVVDGCVVVTLDETKRAMKMLAEKTRVIAEGAGALSLAAALSGKIQSDGPIVAVISGGNVDFTTFCELIASV